MIAEILGKKPFLIGVPIAVFDAIEQLISKLASLLGSQGLDDAAELARIGRYYAVEDMLTTEPAEKYGKIRLRDHYENVAVNGQEYDPYTTVFGARPSE